MILLESHKFQYMLTIIWVSSHLLNSYLVQIQHYLLTNDERFHPIWNRIPLSLVLSLNVIVVHIWHEQHTPYHIVNNTNNIYIFAHMSNFVFPFKFILTYYKVHDLEFILLSKSTIILAKNILIYIFSLPSSSKLYPTIWDKVQKDNLTLPCSPWVDR